MHRQLLIFWLRPKKTCFGATRNRFGNQFPIYAQICDLGLGEVPSFGSFMGPISGGISFSPSRSPSPFEYADVSPPFRVMCDLFLELFEYDLRSATRRQLEPSMSLYLVWVLCWFCNSRHRPKSRGSFGPGLGV